MYEGGIYNRGAMTILNSIIKNNHSELYGGGIYNYNGTMEITDSQIINNSAVLNGGGIYNYSGSIKYALTIHDSSIADDTAPDGVGL
jgi:hypothetical protein